MGSEVRELIAPPRQDTALAAAAAPAQARHAPVKARHASAARQQQPWCAGESGHVAGQSQAHFSVRSSGTGSLPAAESVPEVEGARTL